MITMILHFKGHLPVVVEKDEDGFFVVECPILKGCYTQGETFDEALKNINEVIGMCLEEHKTTLTNQLR
jgi:predicted RNase H-like HicB family nuclease